MKSGLQKVRDDEKATLEESDPFLISHAETPNVKVIKEHIPAEFEQKYRELNEDVQLDYFEIKSDKR